jgi:Zn-dependent protease with chaperone function
MVIVVPVLAFAVAWAYTVGTNHLALIPWRRSAGQHWTERARILYPVRHAASANTWLVPINCALICWISLTPAVLLICATFGAAFIGTALGSYRLDRELFPAFTFGLWARTMTVVLAWQIGSWAILLGALVLMPSEFGWGTLALGSFAVGIFLGLHFGLWRWIMVKVKLLAPPPKKLVEMVCGASVRCGIEYGAVWLLRSPVGYAAALPLTGDLIFSEGLLSAQTPEEIDAICAHELAHLNESRWTVYLSVVVSLWVVPVIFAKPLVETFEGLGLLALVLGVALPALLARRLPRRLEVRADAAAKEHQLEDGVYARALERLHEFNQVPAVMPTDGMAHPHLYDRLVAAGAQPAYPRPARPEGRSWNGGLMILVLFLLLMVSLLSLFRP